LYKNNNVYDIAKITNVHVQTVFKYLNYHGITTPYKSSEENEIVRFLKNNNITNIVRNSRSILPSKKELDIFLPDYNIAIEYNGIYWHHEDVQTITKDYHYNKFQECLDNNIRLITVFSSFWKSKKKIVENIILKQIRNIFKLRVCKKMQNNRSFNR
jgi:hypothetical protein